MNQDEKHSWRERWLTSVNELTSLELQQASWADRANTNPHWSFVEFMGCYFDELAIDDDYQYPLSKGWISEQEFSLIHDWHETLSKYDSPGNNDWDDETILNDPKWLEIIAMGVEAKAKLVQVLDINGKSILFEKINHKLYI